MKALRLPAHASPVAYLFRFRGPRDPPLFVLALRRSRMVGGPIRARALGQPATPLPAHFLVDAGGISQVPRRSIPYLCPGPRPRPDRRSLTLTVSSMLPPLNPRRRLSAAYASRRASPHAMQGSLPAGWLTFTGRELNPLDRDEGFQITSSSLPGLFLAQRPKASKGGNRDRGRWGGAARALWRFERDGCRD